MVKVTIDRDVLQNIITRLHYITRQGEACQAELKTILLEESGEGNGESKTTVQLRKDGDSVTIIR